MSPTDPQRPPGPGDSSKHETHSGNGTPANHETLAAVYDFLVDLQEDRDRGQVRPLSVYLARYPEAEEAIAEEYLRLQVGDDGPAGGEFAQRDGIERYRSLEVIGRGGQGTVELAEDLRLGRRVALKRLDQRALTTVRRERFRREAEAIASIDHPGIAEVLDAGIDGAEPFIALRHVPGHDLATCIRGDANPAPLELPPRSEESLHRVLRTFESAAAALHAAHRARVIHRDVKPANLMVQPDGSAVVLDFGLASISDDEGGSEALTMDGEGLGTPGYMAPEQLRPGGRIDPRTDVHALGASLHEALTGERAFLAPTLRELEALIVEGARPDARELNRVVPKDLAVVVAVAMDPDPERRYASARDFAEDLARVRQYRPVAAQPAGPWIRLRRWARRRPAVAALLVLLLTTLMGGLIAALVALEELNRLVDERDGALDSAHAQVYALRSAERLEGNPAAALALANRAYTLDPTPMSRSALFAPLSASRLEWRIPVPVLATHAIEIDPETGVIYGASESGEGWRADPRTRQVDPLAGALAAVDSSLSVTTDAVGDAFVHTVSEGGDVLLRLDGRANSTAHVAVSPSGELVAAAAAPGHLKVIRRATGELLLDQHGEFAPSALAFGGEGRLAMATKSSFAYLWRIAPRAACFRGPGLGGAVVDAWFLGDGEHAAAVSAAGDLVVFGAPAAESGAAPPGRILQRTSAGGRVSACAHFGDSCALALADRIEVWRIRSALAPELVARWTTGAQVASLAYDEGAVAWLETDGTAHARDLAAPESVHLGDDIALMDTRGRRVATVTRGGVLRIQDAAPGASGAPWVELATPVQTQQGEGVLSFGPGGHRIALGDGRGGLLVLSLSPTGRALEQLVRRRITVFDRCSWSTDGARLALHHHSLGGSVLVLDPESGSTEGLIVGRVDGVSRVLLLDGNRAVMACANGEVVVFEDGSHPHATFGLHGAAVGIAAVRSGEEGLRVLTGDAEGGLHLWPFDPASISLQHPARGVETLERRSIEGP